MGLNIPAAGLVVWAALTTLPLFSLRTYQDRLRLEGGAGQLWQAAGLGFFTLSACVAILVRLDRVSFRPPTRRAFFAYAAWILGLALAPLGVTPMRSILFATAMGFVFVVFVTLWHSYPGSSLAALRVMPYLSIGVIASLYLHLGRGVRSFGAVGANHLGKLALLALVTSVLLSRPRRNLVAAVSIATMVVVSSRSSIVAAAVFVLVYLLFDATTRQRTIRIVAVTAGALVTLDLSTLAFTSRAAPAARFFTSLFRLDDETRGIGSGVTGRATFWRHGLKLIAERPVSGYGINSRDDDLAAFVARELSERTTAHNGVLNMMLDGGVLFAGLVLASIGGSIVACFKLAKRKGSFFPDIDPAAKLPRFAGAFLASLVALWMFEPNYLSLGFPYWIVSILVLALGVQRGTSERSAPPTQDFLEPLGSAYEVRYPGRLLR